MTAEEDPTLIMLQSLSHPLRKMILEILDSRSNATFTELLFLCGLDTYYQKGLLDYHLKNLSDAGIVTRIDNHYMLSGTGRKIIEFLNNISREHKESFVSREGKVEPEQRKPIIGSEKKMKISIKKLPETNLVINSFLFPVGERRKYHTNMFPPESPFKDFDEIDECLEETVERREKCKVIQRTFSEPYHGWCKVYKLARKDGLYTLRAITWEERNPKETDNIYDPPWVDERFPLKAGQKGREEGHEDPQQKELTTIIEWEIIGDYEIKIGRDIRRCLLKRSVITYFLNNELHPGAPQFMAETYYARGLLKVLSRRWDRLGWMKKVGYKNWGESPTLRYNNQVWYLTDETYLAQIVSNT